MTVPRKTPPSASHSSDQHVVEHYPSIEHQDERIQDLYRALSEAENAFARYHDEWDSNRRDYCSMWRYVLATAPPHVQLVAAKQISLYFHHKAQVNIDGDLHNRIERLAYEMQRDRMPPNQAL